MSGWQNEEDIRRDLFEYSNVDYVGGETFTPAPPKSIAEYKARTSKVKNPGLFDDDDIDPNVTVFISGRGKHRSHRIITPGEPVKSLPEDDIAIHKKIREVSGLGYGNEIIEREFGRNSDIEYTDEADDLLVPDVSLHSVCKDTSTTSTLGLSTEFRKCNITEMLFQNNENSSQAKSCNSPKWEKNSNNNARVTKLGSDNSDKTEFLKPETKMLSDHLKLKNQIIKNLPETGRQKVKNQLKYMVETESTSTGETSQSSSSITVNKKSKKKKKFKNFFSDSPTSNVERVHTANVSPWSHVQYNASKINKEDFPSL